jgi:transcriptional antiterminator RfaH
MGKFFSSPPGKALADQCFSSSGGAGAALLDLGRDARAEDSASQHPRVLAEPNNSAIAALADPNPDLVLDGNQRWFLVHTLGHKEQQARMHLRIQGFRTYMPQYQRTIRHARQLRTVRAPLFPGYLFVILDLERDRWLSVRSTIGVSRLVGAADRPLAVPQGIVETLIAHANEANLTLFGDGLQKGQKIRIATGPFAEFIGTLDRLDDSGRVRVLLNMMGSEISISLQRAGVVPAV